MIERVHDGPLAHRARRGDDHAAGRDPPCGLAAGGADDCCAPDDARARQPTGGARPRPCAGVSPVVHVRDAVAPWQHVRLRRRGRRRRRASCCRAGARSGPYDVGALLAAGVVAVAVRPRPVVAILPTGDELIEPDEPRRPGRIVEFNSRMIAAFVREWGGEPLRLAPVGDNLEAVRSRLALAARVGRRGVRDRRLVGRRARLHGGGAGERRHGARARHRRHARQAGDRRDPRRSADGDGAAARARVALGIPGYPVSAAVICRELLAPLLAHLVGRAAPEDDDGDARSRPQRAALAPRPAGAGPRDCVGEVAGRRVLSPLAARRGGDHQHGARRRHRPPRAGGDGRRRRRGGRVELLRPLAEVRGTILVAGSQDPALGVLEDVLRATARAAPARPVARSGAMPGSRRSRAARCTAPRSATSPAASRRRSWCAWCDARSGSWWPPATSLALRTLADLSRPGVARRARSSARRSAC